jgi:ADP-heptose:LPS heptosyltransferase
VLLGVLTRNLRLHWPGAEISVLADPAYADVLGLNPDVNRIWPAPARSWLALAWRLRRERFTHVFNLDNTERTAVVTRLTGAPFRLGLHHGAIPLKLRSFYSHAVCDPAERHESRPITEYYLEALPPAGIPAASREVRLEPREADLSWIRRYVGAAGPVLLVHPGSRSPWRVWPLERFAAVCDRAQDELGAAVVLAGGPGDADKIAGIKSAARSHLFSFSEPLSAPRFAALARLSAVMLGHDSGPMHVAAAVGTPVVALFGSQNSVLFRPAGDGHILVQPPLPCVECVAPERCARADSYHNLCVRRNGVEEVFAAVRRQWERVTKAA